MNTEEQEQQLADKIRPLLQEKIALEEKRRSGITLEKNDYVGDRTKEIDQEINQLKSSNNKSTQP